MAGLVLSKPIIFDATGKKTEGNWEIVGTVSDRANLDEQSSCLLDLQNSPKSVTKKTVTKITLTKSQK